MNMLCILYGCRLYEAIFSFGNKRIFVENEKLRRYEDIGNMCQFGAELC